VLMTQMSQRKVCLTIGYLSELTLSTYLSVSMIVTDRCC